MMKHVYAWLDTTRFAPLFANEKDRAVIFSALAAPLNFAIAIFKLAIGIYFISPWMLGFGCYYLVLILAKTWLLFRYNQMRIRSDRTGQLDIREERRETIFGGALFGLLGLLFTVFSLYMYGHGFNESFPNNWTTYIIALIGFTKLISSIVNLVRARRHQSPIINLLKAFSLADGVVAMIVTQYALLTMQKSAYANVSTGIFGASMGAVIFLLGLLFTFRGIRLSKK